MYDINNYCFEKVINHLSNKNDTNNLEDNGSYDGDDVDDDDYRNGVFMVRTCNHRKICNKIPCIRKCCRDQEKYIRVNKTKMCVPNSMGIHVNFHDFQLHNQLGNNDDFHADIIEPKAFGILQRLECPMYKLSPEYIDSDVFYIHHKDGSLHLPHDERSTSYKNSEYCIENTHTPDGIETYTFICFGDLKGYEIRFILYPIGLSISCFFFTITLIVYSFVPKLRNLPGKVLICLVISLLFAYSSLAVGQIVSLPNESCNPYAYFVYFSFISAFSWMTVRCFDIWLTFGSTKSKSFQKSYECRQFLLYSMFGWGLPLILTSILIIVNKFKLVSDKYLPNFDNGGRCWFEYANAKPHIFYFLAPVGILIFINLILFILTLRYCNKVKNEIRRMQKQNTKKFISKQKFTLDKERFMMNTKLYMIMGISWIIEIISTILYGKMETIVWIPSDIYNSLEGVIVFFIFVFKWRVWYAILDKLGIKHNNGHKMGATTLASPGITSFSASTNNLRMKSVESLSSLINPKISSVTLPKNLGTAL